MSPVTDVYTASCNPSRKAKVPRLPESSPQLGASTTAVPSASIPEDASTSQPQPQPVKRGRKPGTMSKAARETQRKLNHSIIEKARRTKINDALATLRQLVPPDFGNENLKKQADQGDADVEEEDGDDGDYQEKITLKPKKTGKKEEKEREFKLEILIRTVSYMQHLIRRVEELEEQSGTEPLNHSSDPKKRKRDTVTDNTAHPDRGINRRRKLDSPIEQSSEHFSRPRLPSISAWLPEIDPALKSHSHSPPSHTFLSLPLASPAHLPSPPSSTQFKPLSPSHKGLPQLPSLNLGPTAVITRSCSNTLTSTAAAGPATPEEESAATVLLNFRRGASCSPAFLPTPGSSVVFGNGSVSMLTCPSPSPKSTIASATGEFEPVDLTLGPSRTREWSPLTGPSGSLSRTPPLGSGSRNVIAQTPSSILGLKRG
ncbi:hypothetical protein L218DRAFT_957139 [Marasmius fiardii PR-910]|nr:hypothetical protein L218DRAFT_957139 [Marasmius fiardii PR-910]